MRAYVDHVLALLPFEPAVHATARRAALHLCRPSAERTGRRACGRMPEEARRRLADPPLLLVLPGSRGERNPPHGGRIRRRPWRWLAERVGPLEVVVPTVPHLAGHGAGGDRVLAVAGARRDRAGEKDAAFRNARAALTKSGTVDARTGGRRRADGRRLQGAVLEDVIGPPADHGSKRHPGQSGAGRERGAGILQTRLHARAAGRGAGAAVGRYAGAARARSRPSPGSMRIMEIGRAAPSDRAAAVVLDCAGASEPTGARNSGIRPANSVVCLVQPDGLMPWP